MVLDAYYIQSFQSSEKSDTNDTHLNLMDVKRNDDASLIYTFSFQEEQIKMDIPEFDLSLGDHLNKTNSWDYSGNISEDQFIKIGNSFRKFEAEDFTDRNGRFPHISCVAYTALPDLHANYVFLGHNKVICVQYPKLEEAEAFWNTAAICDATIVDLTKDGELEYAYYPKAVGEELTFGAKTIKCIDSQDIDKNMKLITYLVDGRKEVERLHFHQWQDRAALSFDVLKALIDQLYQRKSLMIHCKAGVGRTGTITMALELQTRVLEGQITQDNYRQYIDALIIAGRHQRGDKFVQTYVQYISLTWFTEDLLDIAKTPFDPVDPLVFAEMSRDDAIARLSGKAPGTWLPLMVDKALMIGYVDRNNKVLLRGYGGEGIQISQRAIELDLSRENYTPFLLDN